MTGEGWDGFDPKLVANARRGIVAEPVGRPAWDTEHLADTRKSAMAKTTGTTEELLTLTPTTERIHEKMKSFELTCETGIPTTQSDRSRMTPS